MSAPELTVVIPTWNRAGHLGACLESIMDQTVDASSYDIIISDDGSTDETERVARRYESAERPRVRHLRNAHRGLNATRNSGIRATDASLLMFVDDDELLPHDHLERVVALLRTRDDVDGAGGPLREHDGGSVRTCASCSLADATVPTPDGRATIVDRLIGGNMTIRRRAFERVGEFDEDLSGRGDETEWFSRAGRHFLYDPSLFVWHRRDDMTFRQLWGTQFRQGRALTAGARKEGRSRRPRPIKMLRYGMHGVLRRCGRGHLLVARELGAAAEAVKPTRPTST